MPDATPLRALRQGVAQTRTAVGSPAALTREGALQLVVVAAGVAQWAIGDELRVPMAWLVACTVLTCAALLGRHAWPAAALVTASLVADPLLGALVAVPVAGFAAGRQLPLVRLWVATAVAAAAAGLNTVAAQRGVDEPWPATLLSWVVFALFLLVIPVGCGALLGQRRPAGRLLRERNAHLERTRELTAARARSDERARIAGEMHDMLGHRLSLLSMHAGALELRTEHDAPAVSDQARLVRSTAGTALAELRQILHLTYGTTTGDTAPQPAAGTRADIEALVARSRETGLAVELRWTGDDTHGVDPRTGQAVHRVVREGLTNVHEHAPTTPAVRVEVEIGRGRATVTVVNAPRTSRAGGIGTRRGLVGLEERASLLGGTCRGRPTPDGGFMLALDVPTAPDGVPASQDAARHHDVEPDLMIDEPPPLDQAAVMSPRRMVGVVALAAVVVVPLALLVLLLVLALAQGAW